MLKLNSKTILYATALFLLFVVAPQKANSKQFDYDQLMSECALILNPSICVRFRNVGKESFLAFEHALEILFIKGMREANRELERMLDDIEHGFPLIKNKGTWL